MNDPVSGRLHPFLLFLHGFLAPEHTQGELINPGLHHSPKLSLHEAVLPRRPFQIFKAHHGFFPVPLKAHRIGVLFHVLAPRVILLYRVLPLEDIIPVRFLVLVAGDGIGFVFHVFTTCRLPAPGSAKNSRGAAASDRVSFDVLQLCSASLPLFFCECKLRQGGSGGSVRSAFLGYRHLLLAFYNLTPRALRFLCQAGASGLLRFISIKRLML